MAKSGQDEQAKPGENPGLVLSRESLQRTGRGPVYRQIYVSIKEAILVGSFPNGARLPSSRSLATQLGLSRTTVDLAYNLLAGDGLVQGRTAKGTVVTSSLQRRATVRAEPDAATAPLSSARGPLDPDAAAIDFFPRKAWCRLATRHAKNLLSEDMLPHDRAGHPRLREAVANRVRLVRGISCDASQVFVTAGAGGAMLLIGRALALARGRLVADAPQLPTEVRHALDLLGVRVVPFPSTVGSTSALPSAKLAICYAADFAFTGEPWSGEALDALVGWSRKHASWLVEDDRDLDLYEAGPHEAVLARGASAERTIYLGSFERSVFPQVGCGFIVVPHGLAQSFAAAAQQQAYNSPLQVQRTLSDFITQGYIGRHANRLRKAHAERRKAALAALRRGAFTGELSFRAAGSYLVASFRNVSDPGLLERALEESRVGARVLPRPSRQEHLLLVGYAGAPREELSAAIATLDALLTRSCRRGT